MRIFLVIVLICSLMGTTFAQTLGQRQDELNKKADTERQKMEKADQKMDEVSEQMRAMQEDLDNANAQYSETKAKLDEANTQLEEKQKQLTETEASLKKNRQNLQKRVRNIYMHGQISYLDILFGAKDFSDFLTRMDLIKRILRYDYDLITKINDERNTIAETKKTLEKNKLAAEKLFDDAMSKKLVLDRKKDALNRMMDKLKYDRKTSEKAYQEIMTASANITRMLQNHSVSSVVGTGQMIWPLSGPVTSEFGWRTHPVYGSARFHSGIDIGGDYGLGVAAADAGTVSYAGWISGYGNTVIIDHGNGISTLYGHNQSLTVRVGQNVSQGEIVAKCGSTGNSTGPHCHFEVRVNGEPTSPYGYL